MTLGEYIQYECEKSAEEAAEEAAKVKTEAAKTEAMEVYTSHPDQTR